MTSYLYLLNYRFFFNWIFYVDLIISSFFFFLEFRNGEWLIHARRTPCPCYEQNQATKRNENSTLTKTSSGDLNDQRRNQEIVTAAHTTHTQKKNWEIIYSTWMN